MTSSKWAIALTAFALAAFGLVACGGDDEPAPPPPEEATQPEEPPEDEQAAAEGGTIEVEADPDGALAYTTGELETDAGEVTIEFDNPSSVPHDVRIEDADGSDAGGTEVITQDQTTATVDLEPGSYTYYCSVSGHREGGMEDALEVR